MILGNVINFIFNRHLIKFICKNTTIEVTPKVKGITFHKIFEYNNKTNFPIIDHYFINHSPDQIVFVADNNFKFIFNILLFGTMMAGIYNLEDIIVIKHSESENIENFENKYLDNYPINYQAKNCSYQLGTILQIIKSSKRVKLLFFNNCIIDIETFDNDNLIINFLIDDLKYVAYYYTMDINDKVMIMLIDDKNKEYTISGSKKMNIQMYSNSEYIYRIFN